jgi:hypothetical protein
MRRGKRADAAFQAFHETVEIAGAPAVGAMIDSTLAKVFFTRWFSSRVSESQIELLLEPGERHAVFTHPG